MKFKEITNMKDLKDILATIPDKDLRKFGIAPNNDCDGEITVCLDGEFNQEDEGFELFDKYPQLDIVARYISAICSHHEKYVDQVDDDIDDFISSSEIKKMEKDYEVTERILP